MMTRLLACSLAGQNTTVVWMPEEGQLFSMGEVQGDRGPRKNKKRDLSLPWWVTSLM